MATGVFSKLAFAVLLLMCSAVSALLDDTNAGDAVPVLVQQLMSTVDGLKARIDEQEQEITRLKEAVAVEKKAAFSAHIHSSGHVAAPAQIIPFHSVDTNSGNAFNANDSIFIAPYDGDYFFIVSLDVSPEYESVTVKRNALTFIHADKDDNVTTHLTGSGVVTLTTGDKVAVYHNSYVGSLDGGDDCTFSGFLIAGG